MAKVCGSVGPAIVTNMKDSTRMIRNRGMGYSHGRRAMYTKAITSRMLGMGMDRCIGAMAASIKASGGVGFSMGRAKYTSLAKDTKKGYSKTMYS